MTAFLVVVLGPGIAAAQTYEGARLLGFADSQRALASDNNAIYVNPAGLAMSQFYSVELGYFDDFEGTDRRFNASIVDSQAGPIAGGLAYTYTTRRPDGVADDSPRRFDGHRVELALATLLAENVSFGVNNRYVAFNRRPDADADPDTSFQVFQIDAGLQWRLTEGLAVGLAGYNLNKSDRPEMPISWGAGLGYQAPWFAVEFDVRYNAQVGKPRFSGALEAILAEVVLLRGGAAYDRLDDSWAISAGAGFFVERFGIDVGYRQRLTGDELRDYGSERIFGISMRALFL